MFRSLHMKLVLIMVLLIVSLMTVVGAFLINSVMGFYINDFYAQMRDVFQEDLLFVKDLETSAEGETREDALDNLKELMDAYRGGLGVNSGSSRGSRNYYILDPDTGAYLRGSAEEEGMVLAKTPNLLSVINSTQRHAVGDESDITQNYMDFAVRIERSGTPYIIYIYDNRQTVQDLNSSLFTLILQALVFGLIISVLLSFLLAKTMITPIEKLTDGVKRVAAGEFTRKIEVGSKDEIGILTGNFNNMARQLQDTIREAESERNKLDTLFLHMTDGVVAFDRSGSVIHKNPASEEMLGRAIAPGDFFPAIFGGQISMGEVLSLRDQPGYLEAEREVEGKNLELIMAPFDRESPDGGILAVIHDVTEQRKTEALRREFVANVSHELRTPLTNIRSYAETLAESEDVPRDMEKSFLGVILGESDRMTHIVQDLLTLSRFDSGRSELNLVRFSFETAILDMYNATLLEAQRHGHAVTMDVPRALPHILGDRERILQVMMNIVSNAIKYTPDGGRIAITAGSGRGGVWMEVSDNGIGIPAEDRSRIFERFYRVDKARSRESGGTGLGLSIAKEIIDRHEGVICLVDRAGPGLTIRIELPVEGPSHGG